MIDHRVEEVLVWVPRLLGGLLVIFCVLATTAVLGRSQAVNSSGDLGYEVASIKQNKAGMGEIPRWDFSPDGFTAQNRTLRELIQFAYGLQDYQISEQPKWINEERFDIEARLPARIAAKMQNLNMQERTIDEQPRLRLLLTERFKLAVHMEAKTLPIYALSIAKGGPKIQQAKPGDTYPSGLIDIEGKGHAGILRRGPGLIIGQGIPISQDTGCSMVCALTFELDRPVVDMTGLPGNYDFTLRWTPEARQVMFAEPDDNQRSDGTRSTETVGPSIFSAIQEQLGLKLKPDKGSVKFLVIDHIEYPSPN